MKSAVFIICLLLIIVSCKKSKYAGYSITESGLDYRLHVIGEGDRLAEKGDFVLPSIVVSDTLDSVIYTNGMAVGEALVHKITEAKNAGLNEAFSMLYEGDSASFILGGARINLDKLCMIEGLNGRYNPIKVAVKMNRILSPADVDSLERLSEWLKDEEMNEQIVLNNFLKENQISSEQYQDGIYFLSQKEGAGRLAAGGSFIRVHYKAYFTDGRVFDNTYEYSNALELDLGKPDQLLEGFEIGIRKMKAGGKATFIIPSQLAFGDKGSSTGIVAPYTTLIYEVELLSVSPS